jgi:hypothetical protein
MPVLLGLLPILTDPTLVRAVAAHLRRPWARPTAFGPLVDAFQRWAPQGGDAGWQLGDELAMLLRCTISRSCLTSWPKPATAQPGR